MKRWEYVTTPVAPGESLFSVLREQGATGWEAWHIEKTPDGWREIYFKKQTQE